MNDYKVYENQSLFDISAHVYGHCDAVWNLSILNNVSITDIIKAGTIIKLVEYPSNLLVKKALESRAIIPATVYTETKKSKELIGFPYGFPVQF